MWRWRDRERLRPSDEHSLALVLKNSYTSGSKDLHYISETTYTDGWLDGIINTITLREDQIERMMENPKSV